MTKQNSIVSQLSDFFSSGAKGEKKAIVPQKFH